MSEKVTFQELIDSIAKETNNSKKFTHDFLKDLVSVINSGLESDGSVNIAGLGKFRLRRMDEREGYNPQTGEKMTIAAHNKVVFKPYKDLREVVNAAYIDEEPKLIEEDESTAPQEDTEDTLGEDKGNIPAVPPAGSDAEDAEVKTEDADDDQAPWDAGKEERDTQEDPFGINDSEKGGEDEDKDVVEFQPEDKESSSLDRHLDKVKKQQRTPEPEEEEVETEQEPAEEPEPVMASQEDSQQEDPASYIPYFQEKDTPPWVWGAAAVVGLLIIVFAVLFFSPGDSAEQQAETLATTQSQSEQVAGQPGQQESQSQGDQAQAQTTTSGTETESQSQSEAPAQTAGQGEGNNQPQQLQPNDPIVRSVARGQTLWGLAKKEYEDPYLWPWIYDANKATIQNPDVILVGQTLSIPVPDEENYGLSSTDSLEVAIGYIETYRWYKNNGHDQAKFYLWAAKIYDQNVFDHVTQPIDEDDLAFANRVR